MSKRTPSEVDTDLTVHAERIEDLQQATGKTADIVETIRREYDAKIGVLQAELANTKKENADLKDAQRRTEEYIRTLLTTTIFSLVGALVALGITLVKK